MGAMGVYYGMGFSILLAVRLPCGALLRALGLEDLDMSRRSRDVFRSGTGCPTVPDLASDLRLLPDLTYCFIPRLITSKGNGLILVPVLDHAKRLTRLLS